MANPYPKNVTELVDRAKRALERDPSDLAAACYEEALRLHEQRVAELEQELQTMTNDRDQWQRRLLKRDEELRTLMQRRSKANRHKARRIARACA